MKNKDVIDAFLTGENHCKTGSMEFIPPDKLYSYSTCIAEYDDEELLVNMSKYSVTTTRHQSELIRQIGQIPCTLLTNIPRNIVSLKKFKNDKKYKYELI